MKAKDLLKTQWEYLKKTMDEQLKLIISLLSEQNKTKEQETGEKKKANNEARSEKTSTDKNTGIA